MYWRFDEEIQHVELDYPRDLPSVWRGVPAGVDAAFRHTDGNTYFFLGSDYWRFDDRRMRVASARPGAVGERWMRCRRRGDIRDPFSRKGEEGGLVGAAPARPIFDVIAAGVLSLLASHYSYRIVQC